MGVIQKIESRIKLDVRRALNRRTAYSYPAENDGWVKYEIPVLGGKEGTFYDPFVRKINENYVMFVSHRNTKSIVRCDSKDGIHWSKPVSVLEFNEESGWEDRVNRASYWIKDGIWYLWYTGMTEKEAKIGLAWSKDGYYFERYQKKPVIVPTESYEKGAVMNPCVLWDDTAALFKMWYSAGEKFEPDVLCFATSNDGINWTKHKRNPIFTHGVDKYDQYKVGGCDIIKINGKYVQFYIGYENIDTARICMAESSDGIHWKRNEQNPILAATKRAWDSDAVYKPSVCIDVAENKAYLWYNGRKKHDEYIGLATKILKRQKE